MKTKLAKDLKNNDQIWMKSEGRLVRSCVQSIEVDRGMVTIYSCLGERKVPGTQAFKLHHWHRNDD